MLTPSPQSEVLYTDLTMLFLKTLTENERLSSDFTRSVLCGDLAKQPLTGS